ncbi:alpha/beta fold hydrolase, partial [Streptomyces sp. NPDC054841]
MISYENTSRTVRISSGLTLHYHEAGPVDAPALVLLHGGGPGASAWSNFGRSLPFFAERFRTLLVDQPGFGASDKPVPDRDYYTFSADAVAALMDELALDRAHFLGVSL